MEETILADAELTKIMLAKSPEVFCSRCGENATDTWGFRVQGYDGKPDIYLCNRCCYDMLARAISYLPAKKG